MPPKGRKKATGVAAGEAASLLDAISNDALDARELLRVLGADKPACDHMRAPCRVNRKDHTACFCQLAPAETSFRKKGLWQKGQSYLDSLGSDPHDKTRKDLSHPAGLRNLGNTCYANAALQCLFSIPLLRNTLYKAETQVAAHDIFRSLQQLFARIQFGPCSSVDTEDLAKTLGLNHAIQQDGQEFLKLLLHRVEQLLSKSGDEAARGIVQQLFRGRLSYVTTCQSCGRDSPSSSNLQDFYDLMPQVRGFTSLEESLASMLAAESLSGDNQYLCEYCEGKVDALRRVVLRVLPPYLCLSLQRFYFNPNTGDKAKALDKFSFPLQLDMHAVLDAAEHAGAQLGSDYVEAAAGVQAAEGVDAARETSAVHSSSLPPPTYSGGPRYELVGILIHKGSQASSGHYVAHIKDQATQQWWRFDDEEARLIGPDPTFPEDHGAAAAAAAGRAASSAAPKGGNGRKRKAGGDDGEDDDYDNEAEEKDLQQREQADAAPAQRGRKRSAASRGRAASRAAKRGGGRGRGRRGGEVEAIGGDSDEELRMALQASMQEPGKGATDAHDDEQAVLRLAVEASLHEQQRRHKDDAQLTAALRESARGEAAGAGTGPEPTTAEASGKEVGGNARASPDKDAATPGEGMGGDRPVVASEQRGNSHANDDVHGVRDAERLESKQAQASTAAAVLAEVQQPASSRLISANAYLLMYRAIGYSEAPALSRVEDLPTPLQEAINAEAAAFLEQCDIHERQKEQLTQQVEGRRATIRKLLPILPPRLADAVPEASTVVLGPSESGPGPSPGAEPPKDGPSAAADAGNAASSGYWVSAAWLERWANDEAAPPPIDNTPLVCTRHRPPGAASACAISGSADASEPAGADANGSTDGGTVTAGAAACMNPAQVSAAKLLSREAWMELLEAHGGGPALPATAVCRECLAGRLNTTVLGSRADRVRARVAALLEEGGPGGGGAGAGAAVGDEEGDVMEVDAPGASGSARQYWVSRTWLQGWSKRQGASVKAEKSPTADLACPHGGMLPASLFKTARRVALPEDIWRFLRDLWRQQRLAEAEEEARSRPAGGAKRGRPGRASAAAAAAATAAAAAKPADCMVDLTADEQEPQAQAAAVSAGAGDAHEGSPAPPDATATEPAEAAATTAPAVPTPEELDRLCPEFAVWQARECSECRAAAGVAAEAHADTRRQLEAERTALGGLAADVVPLVEPGESYYLVPSDWVRGWQLYVRSGPRGRSGAAAAGAGGAAVAGGGGNGAAPQRPGPLPAAMAQLLCPCHPKEPRLGVPLPKLVAKRNKLLQRDCEEDALRLVTKEDWASLRSRYCGIGACQPAAATAGLASASPVRDRQVRRARGRNAAPVSLLSEDDGDSDVVVMEADVAPDTRGAPAVDLQPPDADSSGADRDSAPSTSAGPSQEQLAAVQNGFRAEVVLPSTPPPAAVLRGSTPLGADGNAEGPGPSAPRDAAAVPELRAWPPVCPDALAAHDRAAREALLGYSEAEVLVELIKEEELEGAFKDTGGVERKSRRSRKGRAALTVSNTTTLHHLKLQVYSTLGVHPLNQMLYVRGESGGPRQLQGDELSLAQHEVAPGQELRLVRAANVDDDDDVAGLVGEGSRRRRHVEEGFKNTALHGDMPLPQHDAGDVTLVEPVAECAVPSGDSDDTGAAADDLRADTPPPFAKAG